MHTFEFSSGRRNSILANAAWAVDGLSRIRPGKGAGAQLGEEIAGYQAILASEERKS